MVLAHRSEVEHWLKNAPEFPATRDDVLAALEREGAPAEVVAAVRAIPPDTYSRRDQVAAAAAAVPDVTSESTTEAAEQRVEGHVAGGQRDADRPLPDEP